MLKTVKTS